MGQGGMDVNEMSMQISFQIMNSTMESCFRDCVSDFRAGELSSNEQTCLKNCAVRGFNTMQIMGELQDKLQGQAGAQGRFWNWKGIKS